MLILPSSMSSSGRKTTAPLFKSVFDQLFLKMDDIEKSHEQKAKRAFERAKAEIIGDVTQESLLKNSSGIEYHREDFFREFYFKFQEKTLEEFESLLRKQKPTAEDLKAIMTGRISNAIESGVSESELNKIIESQDFEVVEDAPSTIWEELEYKAVAFDFIRSVMQEPINRLSLATTIANSIKKTESSRLHIELSKEFQEALNGLLEKQGKEFRKPNDSTIIEFPNSAYNRS